MLLKSACDTYFRSNWIEELNWRWSLMGECEPRCSPDEDHEERADQMTVRSLVRCKPNRIAQCWETIWTGAGSDVSGESNVRMISMARRDQLNTHRDDEAWRIGLLGWRKLVLIWSGVDETRIRTSLGWLTSGDCLIVLSICHYWWIELRVILQFRTNERTTEIKRTKWPLIGGC